MTARTFAAPAWRAERPIGGRGWIRLLVGYLVLWGGALAGLGGLDATGRWGVPILVGVAAAAVVVELVLYRADLRTAVRRLGFGRPSARAVVVAAAVSLLVVGVYPLTTAVTGEPVGLVSDWPGILLGLFAFHGLAEELVWRGFIFRRLHEGRSFARAVLSTMPFIVAAHIPILLTAGPLVAVGAMAVAAVTSIPLGRLYLAGRRTVWAPALIHTAIDSFKLVIIPVAVAPTFSLLLITVSLLVPLLALVGLTGRSGRPVSASG